MNVTLTFRKVVNISLRIWILLLFLTATAASSWAQNSKTVIGSYNTFKNSFSTESRPGARIADQKNSLPVSSGKSLEATINYRKTSGVSEIFAGNIDKETGANFFIYFSNGKVDGKIILPKSKKAYSYASDKNGNVTVEAVDINKVVCVEYGNIAATTNVAPAASASPVTVPLLQSLPGAPAVIFLDFDGQYVVSPAWNGGVPINATPTNFNTDGIRQVWEITSEDFRAFNINVTTDSTVFHNTPVGHRTRVIITNTSEWAGFYGGVAYVNSFNEGTDHPCWVFENNLGGPENTAEATSHEAGHTLGLIHDGRDIPGNPREEYYSGHGEWGPIMGVSYGRTVSHWSIGEFQYAYNPEDDIAIIARDVNGAGLRADDHGNTNATAKTLVVGSDGRVSPANNKGIITTRTDIDVFTFTSKGGYIYLTILPNAVAPNLNILANLYDQNNILVASSNPSSVKAPVFTFNDLPSGKYYLQIDGVGEGDPFIDGYSDYSSLGAYSVSGIILGPACPQASWSATREYQASEQVSHKGFTYYAKWWTKGEDPATHSGQYDSWQLMGTCGNNKKPVATITAPANNSSVNQGTSVTLTATASDVDGFVTRVEIYQDDTLVATLFDAPYTYTRLNAPAGLHNFSVIAYDNYNAASTEVYTAINVNALPIGQFTSPAFSSSYKPGSNVTVTVVASDPDGTVAKVEFFYFFQQRPPVKIGEATTAPYTVTAVVPVERYLTIQALITDNKGAQTTIYNFIQIVSDQAPVVTITSPANNSTFSVGSTVNITANVTSPVGNGISLVYFYQNEMFVGNATTAPYKYTLTNAASGTYTYRVIAFDVTGLQSAPAYVTFKVGTGNQLPAVTITSPAHRTKYKVGGAVTITANAADPDGQITKVEIYSPHIPNSNVVLTFPWGGPNTYAATFTNLPGSGVRGATSFVVKATDNSGAISSTSIDLLENRIPTVSITSPSNNATYYVGSTVKIIATPSDQDGPISRVDFFDKNNVLVGSSTIAPYELTLTNVALGSYTYKAKAYDEMTAVSTTASVNFSVINPTCTVPAWSATAVYTNQRVSYNGTVYEAKWWTQGENPSTHSGPYDAWKIIGPCNNASKMETSVTTVNSASVSPVPLESTSNLYVTIPVAGFVQIDVYNVNGFLVTTLVKGDLGVGDYKFELNSTDLPAGIYLIKITSPENNETIRVNKN